MKKDQEVEKLLQKVKKVSVENNLDLSSDEDLSIGIMNLISIEEHLFFTSQKTGNKSYLDLLNEVRVMRTELMKMIIKDYEGEVWCISKHLLAVSMRLIEVGTKELKKGDEQKASGLFSKAYQLYSLFWGLNLKVVKMDDVKRDDADVHLVGDKGEKTQTASLMGRLGQIVQKAIDCCKE